MIINRPVIGSVCTSRSWGGLEMNILEHLRWLRERGWPIVLYAEPGSSLATNCAQLDIKVCPMALGTKTSLPLYVPKLSRRLKEDRVAILMTHQSKDIPLGVLTKRLLRNKVHVLYAQQMHVGRDKKDWLHTWLYRQLDAWVTPLHWLEDRVYEKTKLPRGRTHVIPLGVEMRRFSNIHLDKQSARKTLGLKEAGYLIGVVGRLDPKKCQDTAIRAVKQVHDRGHDVHLLLVGDRTYGESMGYVAQIDRLINELSLENHITMLPGQKDVEKVYAALDLFVLPSASETYGMVTIEAMASQLPIIATKSGGTQEIISHEQTGLLFTPRNDQELAECILRYLGGPEFANACAQKARTDAIHRFSHDVQCDGLERLFSKLISQAE
jgi:glycosyltransferase involved in cell wall biosynthesis